jgi:hypothetical protein
VKRPRRLLAAAALAATGVVAVADLAIQSAEASETH